MFVMIRIIRIFSKLNHSDCCFMLNASDIEGKNAQRFDLQNVSSLIRPLEQMTDEQMRLPKRE